MYKVMMRITYHLEFFSGNVIIHLQLPTVHVIHILMLIDGVFLLKCRGEHNPVMNPSL